MKLKKIIKLGLICLFLMESKGVLHAATNIDLPTEEDKIVTSLPDLGYTLNKSNLPQVVDWSKNSCFPPIRTQNNFGSCVSFATTYYQFGFQANVLCGNTGDGYSKSWLYAYNYMNEGKNQGVGTSDTYNFLCQNGSVRFHHFYDETGWFTADYTLPFLTDDELIIAHLTQSDVDVQERLKALNVRVKNWYRYEFQIGTDITGPKSDCLTGIKTLLANGKILVCGVTWNPDIAPAQNNENVGQPVIYRMGIYTSEFFGYNFWHMLAIVGYNDNIWVDVNQDGIKQQVECGAIKIANSWGKTWPQQVNGVKYNGDGTAWILYDAMNRWTNIPGNWEELDDEKYDDFRAPVLADNNGWARVFFIDVAKKNNYVLAKLDYSLSNRSDYQIYLEKNYIYTEMFKRNNGPTAITTTELFDFDEQAESLSQLTGRQYWSVNLSVGDDANTNFTGLNYSLVDNKGNLIAKYQDSNISFGNSIYDEDGDTSQRKRFSITTNLKVGDLNYDGYFSSTDLNLINECLSSINGVKNTASSLQIKLADIDGNGTVNYLDYSTFENLYHTSNNTNWNK